jgi:hypothetical protein
MRLDGQLKFLRENTEGFTHVLYTDGWDAMFTASLDEIVGKYRTAGSPPMLTGGGFMFGNEPDIDKTPYAHLYDKRVKYRYPSMAGYIAEIPYLIDIFSRMNKEERADDNFAWAEAVREGWFAPVVDTSCQIFQDQEDDCALDNGRLYNLLTDSQPCILHLGGGYVNPETGKDERLLPWARKMGIIQ